MREHLPVLLKQAVDFVLDPVRTGRTTLEDLDKVEKTFVGLKIEHYLRDWLGVPKGLKRDLVVDGIEVDIKNTVASTWMIPPETWKNAEPCLLVANVQSDGNCWLGIVVAKETYLTSSIGNRDGKRQLSLAGKSNIMWIVEGEPFPPSVWAGTDMARFRALRLEIKGGKNRAAQFFRENLDRTIHRSVLEALLYPQKDFLKRLRGSGGARDHFAQEGILLLSGVYGAEEALSRGIELKRDEFVAVRKS